MNASDKEHLKTMLVRYLQQVKLARSRVRRKASALDKKLSALPRLVQQCMALVQDLDDPATPNDERAALLRQLADQCEAVEGACWRAQHVIEDVKVGARGAKESTRTLAAQMKSGQEPTKP
jgi:hypothetical protein